MLAPEEETICYYLTDGELNMCQNSMSFNSGF